MTDVMAIGSWRNNAEMIADMPKLGYLNERWITLDPTYGRGKFWTKWRPTNLTTSDLDPASPAEHHWDFTDTGQPSDAYDAVVFDPPYKLNGTSTGKGSSAMDAGYGVAGDYMPWQAKHDLIRDGISECVRVLRPRHLLLLKCMDQVCSGDVRWQTDEFTRHTESLGCAKVDEFHIPSHRAQPAGRRQVHARRNYSTLLIFRKGKR
jgi:hypothetical protein